MLAEWVAEGLSKAGFTQADLARLLTQRLGRSVDRAAVNKMISDERRVAGDELLAIASITGLPPPGYQVQNVPLLSWISAGRLADTDTQIQPGDVPLLAFTDLGRGDFFALKVHGDSMDRLSPDGSVIVINREDRELVPSKPFVFAVRGEATYKLWRPRPARLAPYSTNPSNEPIFVEDEEALEVVGRVKRTLLDL